ncbi:type II toxin-antitoxin system RelE family toxin [Entomobacter blattae]|uniref:Type II toxin-antitoxin system RelE/ParE family toxin n=1 Tax=Entomobacter blattae TaxID=2762277 RepID=A0A7H1NUJ0_9PROT|nr:type II toxin-antitoxin system RelE/ParE family toxin [Entomobacter blattae]QNT79450.1 hypothetical protein JGUZn3_22490 [Entomobacter blattae]
MELEYTISALKDLKALPAHDSKALRKALLLVAEKHPENPGFVKALTGTMAGHYRVRKGNWRALFEVVDNKMVVYRVAHRKEVYE